MDRLAGSSRFRDAVELDSIDQLVPVLEQESRDFQAMTAPFLIYPLR
jgi:hypothetical protein